MTKAVALACMLQCSLHGWSQGFAFTYSFSAVTPSTGIQDPSPLPQAAGVTCGAFAASGVSLNPNATGRFSFQGWPLGAINGSDTVAQFTGVLSPLAYYEVTIDAAPSYTLTLDSINFSVRRSSTGIRNYAARWSIDNYAANLPASTGTNSNLSVMIDYSFFWRYDSISTATDQKGSVIQLNGITVTQPVTFRFYAWNAESSGGTFSIDNVTFRGTATTLSTTPQPTVDTGVSGYILPKPIVFPNPCTDRITIAGADAGSYRIVDAEGKYLSASCTDESAFICVKSFPPIFYLIFQDKKFTIYRQPQ